MTLYPHIGSLPEKGKEFATRTAAPADVATIVTHRRAMFEAMGNPDCTALDVMDEKIKPWVTGKMAVAEYRHWFATIALASFVAGAGIRIMNWAAHPIDQSERRGNILNVFTHRDCRKRGLTKKLTTLILDGCRENSIETVVLNTSEAGRPIHESLGFRPTNEMRIRIL